MKRRSANPTDRPASEKYEIGYGKPPVNTRFSKGNREYLKRRKRAAEGYEGEIIVRILQSKTTFRESGKAKVGRRIQLLIRSHSQAAMKGDVVAALELIRLHERFREIGPLAKTIVFISEDDARV